MHFYSGQPHGLPYSTSIHQMAALYYRLTSTKIKNIYRLTFWIFFFILLFKSNFGITTWLDFNQLHFSTSHIDWLLFWASRHRPTALFYPVGINRLHSSGRSTLIDFQDFIMQVTSSFSTGKAGGYNHTSWPAVRPAKIYLTRPLPAPG